jgi:hypothetical protein
LTQYAPDREHPSIHGTYLATAVLYAVLFIRNPEGIAYAPAAIAAEDAKFVRRVAWETVQNYRQ